MAENNLRSYLSHDMEDKDPHLYAEIWSLPVTDAIERWLEKYPNDFPEGWQSLPLDYRLPGYEPTP